MRDCGNDSLPLLDRPYLYRLDCSGWKRNKETGLVLKYEGPLMQCGDGSQDSRFDNDYLCDHHAREAGWLW